jgi:hypothetical protein
VRKAIGSVRKAIGCRVAIVIGRFLIPMVERAFFFDQCNHMFGRNDRVFGPRKVYLSG